MILVCLFNDKPLNKTLFITHQYTHKFQISVITFGPEGLTKITHVKPIYDRLTVS